MDCKKCGSDSIIKAGHRLRHGGYVQAYQCRECGHVFVEKDEK